MTINARIDGNRVIFTADNETRAELAYHYRKGDYARVEQEVSEGLHERWTAISPEDVGALTDAPIFCDDVNYRDDGSVEAIGRVCWYPNYCITDPYRELANKGRMTFELAPEDAA